jgi:hypothetical protein
MFSRQLIHAGRTRSFVVSSLQSDGWEVRVEEDGRLLRGVRYTDWHRVERALAALEREMDVLKDHGWTTSTDTASAAAQSTNR